MPEDYSIIFSSICFRNPTPPPPTFIFFPQSFRSLSFYVTLDCYQCLISEFEGVFHSLIPAFSACSCRGGSEKYTNNQCALECFSVAHSFPLFANKSLASCLFARNFFISFNLLIHIFLQSQRKS